MSKLILGESAPGLTAWFINASPWTVAVTADNPFPAPPHLVLHDDTAPLVSTLDGPGTTAAWSLTQAQVVALLEVNRHNRPLTLSDPLTGQVWAHGTSYVQHVNGTGTPSSVPAGGSLTVDNLDGQIHITYTVGEGAGGASDAAVAALVADETPSLTRAALDAEYVADDDARLADARTPTAHDHVLEDITDYTPPDLSGFVEDDDPRLADARTPTAHAASHGTGSTDPITPASIGAAAASHNQAASTISDLTEAVQDIVGAFIVAGTNVTVTYDDVANTFTINATAETPEGTDPEIVRDVIGAALVAGSGIQITVDDAGDQITVSSTAVLPTRQVATGVGLSGGGDLSADRTLSVDFGTTSTTVAVGNDSRITGAAQKSANLSDLADAPTARTNLGLGTAATTAATAYATAAQGTLAGTAVQPAIVDAKGDLIAATGADAVARLAVGTNGHVLTADSAEATGVKWAAPAGGGSDPWTYYVVGSDQANNTTTYATLLSVPSGLVAGQYQVRLAITGTSGSGGLTVGVDRPSNTRVDGYMSSTTSSSNIPRKWIAGAGPGISSDSEAVVGSGSAFQHPLCESDFILTVTSTTAAALTVAFKAGTGGTNIVVKPGSYLAIRRIA